MAVNPPSSWQSTFAALPAVADNSWANNLSTWYAGEIAGIQPDPAALVDPLFVFTFDSATFTSQLLSLTPTDDLVSGMQGFADAWESALLTSVAVVNPGAYIPPPSPATTFSAVSSTVIDLTSIAAGKSKLLELTAAPLVSDPLNSAFPVKFREATLLLTVTATGLNSVTPTPGPLTAAMVPLI